MHFSTSGNTLSNITTSTYKDFKELSAALWKNPETAEHILHATGGAKPQKIERHYTLREASRVLGKSEAAFRLFLWESGLVADERVNGVPVFSEELVDLIESHGYLFEYAKKWKSVGHHTEAESLLREARKVFGDASPDYRAKSNVEVDSIAPQDIEEWAVVAESLELGRVYI